MTTLGPFARLPRPELREPWLTLDLGSRFQVLGWPVVGPSLGAARHIAWLQVCDADLPMGEDPADLFRRRALADGVEAEVGLMTAAEVRRFAHLQRRSPAGAISVTATSGLGNGESVLPRPASVEVRRPAEHIGTINVVAVLSAPLSFAAALEALSIVAQARTAAVMQLGLTLPQDGRPVTGTGTDCILIASPLANQCTNHCGLHTGIGRLLGETAYAAVLETSTAWLGAQTR